jgi:pantoate--beta-alanine ligase
VPELIWQIGATRDRIVHWKSEAKTVGFVPTMGSLHAGHGALIDRARQECDHVVVSIFVNPIQFNQRQDFENYTRDLTGDLAFCEAHGADLVFAPEAAEMYPEPQSTFVDVEEVSKYLEGEFRPGHFRGVATVVAKLFHIVPAHRAYFGQKDAQQLAVIKRMVAGLNFPITIVPVETVRESDGLAMSSRNSRLSPEQRAVAPIIHRALEVAEACLRAGGEVDAIKAAGLQVLHTEPQIQVEYFDVADASTMHPVRQISGDICIATAVFLGTTRLIDNVLIPAFHEAPKP